MRHIVAFALISSLAVSVLAFAQSGDASLHGYVRGESGAILPGVTVTATSPAIMAPRVVVSDGTGYYRVLNLPPGTYALKAELSGSPPSAARKSSSAPARTSASTSG